MEFQTMKASGARIFGAGFLRASLLRAIAVLAVLMAPLASHATMLTPSNSGSIEVLDVSALISDKQTTRAAFTIPFAGQVTVTLRDLAWPEKLASLSFCLTDSHEVLGRLSAPGSVSIDVGTPDKLFAFVSGGAEGALDLGLYSLQVTLAPLTGLAPVPLPATSWLLLSGFGIVMVLRRPASNNKV
jgi:hypothetical protein